MNEIATHSMILQKIQLGQTSNYCPTKTEILEIDKNVIINNATDYLDNECVKIVDIEKQQNISAERYVWNHIGLEQNESYIPVQNQNDSKIKFAASKPNQYIEYTWQIQSYKEVLINDVVDHIEPLMPQFTGVNEDLCEVSVTTSSVNNYTFDIQINVSANRTVYNWESEKDPLRIHQFIGGHNYNTISTKKDRVNLGCIINTTFEKFMSYRDVYVSYLGCSHNPKYKVSYYTIKPLNKSSLYTPISKFGCGTQIYLNSSLEKAESYADIHIAIPDTQQSLPEISSYVNVESVYSGASNIFTAQILQDRVRITRVSNTEYIPTNDGLAFKINVNMLGYTDLVLEIYAINDWNLIG